MIAVSYYYNTVQENSTTTVIVVLLSWINSELRKEPLKLRILKNILLIWFSVGPIVFSPNPVWKYSTLLLYPVCNLISNKKNVILLNTHKLLPRSSPRMQPVAHMSMLVVWVRVCNKSSGARYQRVTTLGVIGLTGSPNQRASPKSAVQKSQQIQVRAQMMLHY